MRDFFIKFLKMLDKPKYIRVGSCKRCGTCCRNITFKIQDKFITEVEEFEKLKAWQRKYDYFFVSGKDENGILLFTCKSLGEDNLCKSYWLRSLFCRSYPKVKPGLISLGYKTFEQCGFYFKSSVEFEEFLKKE